MRLDLRVYHCSSCIDRPALAFPALAPVPATSNGILLLRLAENHHFGRDRPVSLKTSLGAFAPAQFLTENKGFIERHFSRFGTVVAIKIPRNSGEMQVKATKSQIKTVTQRDQAVQEDKKRKGQL
jgi:hypothetical protein